MLIPQSILWAALAALAAVKPSCLAHAPRGLCLPQVRTAAIVAARRLQVGTASLIVRDREEAVSERRGSAAHVATCSWRQRVPAPLCRQHGRSAHRLEGWGNVLGCSLTAKVFEDEHADQRHVHAPQRRQLIHSNDCCGDHADQAHDPKPLEVAAA